MPDYAPYLLFGLVALIPAFVIFVVINGRRVRRGRIHHRR